MHEIIENFLSEHRDLNLADEADRTLMGIKLKKSHIKWSDWKAIRDILEQHNLLTFVPVREGGFVRVKGGMPVENSRILVFTGAETLDRHIRVLLTGGDLDKENPVVCRSVSFEEAARIAQEEGLNIYIDPYQPTRCWCEYHHDSQELTAVVR